MAELDEEDDIEDFPKGERNATRRSVQLEDMIEEWNARKHIPAERTTLLLSVLICLPTTIICKINVIRHYGPDFLKGSNIGHAFPAEVLLG